MLRGLGASAVPAVVGGVDCSQFWTALTNPSQCWAFSGGALPANATVQQAIADNAAAVAAAAKLVASNPQAAVSSMPPDAQAALAAYIDPATGAVNWTQYFADQQAATQAAIESTYQQGLNVPLTSLWPGWLTTLLIVAGLGVGGYLVWKAVD